MADIPEAQLAAWLDDQRMALSLGELTPAHAARLRDAAGGRDLLTAPSAWAVAFIRALVSDACGEESALPPRPTWELMAAEARKIIATADHPTPGTWLDESGHGLFSMFAMWSMTDRREP